MKHRTVVKNSVNQHLYPITVIKNVVHHIITTILFIFIIIISTYMYTLFCENTAFFFSFKPISSTLDKLTFIYTTRINTVYKFVCFQTFIVSYISACFFYYIYSTYMLVYTIIIMLIKLVARRLTSMSGLIIYY